MRGNTTTQEKKMVRRSAYTNGETSTSRISGFPFTLAISLGFVSFGVALLTMLNVAKVHSSLSTYHKEDIPAAPPPLITQKDESMRRLETTNTTTTLHVPVVTLSELTTTNNDGIHQDHECPNGLVFIPNRIVSSHNKTLQEQQTIPLVIHQTSKSRCLVPSLAHQAVETWKTFLPQADYFLHDDSAVERLLSLPHLQVEFPHLKDIALHCTRGAMRADLWRYVLLYEYGGIYSDVDTYPNSTTSSSTLPFMERNDRLTDAYFVLEQDGLLSQYFIAIAPRHALMKYTIQATLQNLWKSPDPRKGFAPTLTGPRALHQGFQQYCAGKYNITDSTGQWLGMNHPMTHGDIYTVGQHLVRVDGTLNDTDNIIVRDVIPREMKKTHYQQMNMTYFMVDARKAPRGQSCQALVQASLLESEKQEQERN